MKKITSLILLALLIFSSCDKQNRENYNNLIAEARGLYAAGEYENSGEIYSKAFSVEKGSDTLSHRYEELKVINKFYKPKGGSSLYLISGILPPPHI